MLNSSALIYRDTKLNKAKYKPSGQNSIYLIDHESKQLRSRLLT